MESPVNSQVPSVLSNTMRPSLVVAVIGFSIIRDFLVILSCYFDLVWA